VHPVFHPSRALGACSLVALATVLGFAPAAQAAKQKVCVFDILGTAGDGYNTAKDYALEMQKFGDCYISDGLRFEN